MPHLRSRLPLFVTLLLSATLGACAAEAGGAADDGAATASDELVGGQRFETGFVEVASPDGRYLAFSQRLPTEDRVVRLTVATGRLVVVARRPTTKVNGVDTFGRASVVRPTGPATRLVMTLSDSVSPETEVRVVDWDLTESRSVRYTEPRREAGSFPAEVALSANGQRVLVVASRTDVPGASATIFDAVGAAPEVVAPLRGVRPSLDRQGDVVVSHGEELRGDLVDLGASPATITPVGETLVTSRLDDRANWASFDGSTIFLERTRGPRPGVYVHDLRAGTDAFLTNEAPEFAPTKTHGSSLVYVHEDATERVAVTRLDRDGTATNLVEVPPVPGAFSYVFASTYEGAPFALVRREDVAAGQSTRSTWLVRIDGTAPPQRLPQADYSAQHVPTSGLAWSRDAAAGVIHLVDLRTGATATEPYTSTDRLGLGDGATTVPGGVLAFEACTLPGGASGKRVRRFGFGTTSASSCEDLQGAWKLRSERLPAGVVMAEQNFVKAFLTY